jgi:hypothetical protein
VAWSAVVSDVVNVLGLKALVADAFGADAMAGRARVSEEETNELS